MGKQITGVNRQGFIPAVKDRGRSCTILIGPDEGGHAIGFGYHSEDRKFYCHEISIDTENGAITGLSESLSRHDEFVEHHIEGLVPALQHFIIFNTIRNWLMYSDYTAKKVSINETPYFPNAAYFCELSQAGIRTLIFYPLKGRQAVSPGATPKLTTEGTAAIQHLVDVLNQRS